MSIRRKNFRLRHHRTGIRIALCHTFIRRLRHFCQECQWIWQWHRWCYWYKLHTLDWQIQASTYCTCTPQVYRVSHFVTTESPHINIDLLPVDVWTAKQGRPAPSTIQLKRLDTNHNRHWLMQLKRIWHCVCSAKNKETRTKFKCRECNISLCATPCFEVYKSKLHFWGSDDTKIEK